MLLQVFKPIHQINSSLGQVQKPSQVKIGSVKVNVQLSCRTSLTIWTVQTKWNFSKYSIWGGFKSFSVVAPPNGTLSNNAQTAFKILKCNFLQHNFCCLVQCCVHNSYCQFPQLLTNSLCLKAQWFQCGMKYLLILLLILNLEAGATPIGGTFHMSDCFCLAVSVVSYQATSVTKTEMYVRMWR